MPHPARRFGHPAVLVALALLVSVAAVPASAQTTFTRIADDTTPVPGTVETFDFFGEAPPVLDATSVAFEGDYGGGEAGVFRWDAGVVTTVARTGTLVPPADILERAYSPTLDGGTVGFGGMVDGTRGIYLRIGGLVARLVEEGDVVPGKGGEAFTSVYSPSVDAGELAFLGTDSSFEPGVYKADGDGLSVVADDSTLVPGAGGDTFGELYDPFTDAGRVVFAGAGDSLDPLRGIFLAQGGGLATVVRDGAVASDGAVLQDFANTSPAIDGGQVAFRAVATDFSTGIYLTPAGGGAVTTVAREGGPRPGGGVFGGVSSQPALSEGRVAFDEDGAALWLWEAGTLTLLVQAGDTLDGDVVSEVYLGSEGLDGDLLTFVAYFEDDSVAVYLAELPPVAPVDVADVPVLGGVGSALLILLLAGLGAGFLWLRPSLG